MMSPSAGFLGVAAEPVDLGDQRGEPVRFVPAQVGDAAQPRGAGGERAECGDGGGELAGVGEVGALDFAAAGDRQGAGLQGHGGAHVGQDARARGHPPGWCGRASPGSVRCRADARAAARKGPALERSCSIRWSKARMAPGADDPVVGAESSTATPTPRSTATVMLMWSRLGTGLPACSRCRPSVKRAPTSSRAETNWEEALASMTRCPPRTSPVPATRNGRDAGVPPSSAAHGDAERHQGLDDGAHRALPGRAGSPSKTVAPLRSAASGGTKRMTVPARPQSMAASCAGGASGWSGVTSRSGPKAPSPGTSRDGGAELAQRFDHQGRVPGMQRGPQPGRAVGQGREHEVPVGQGLRTGHA